MASVNLEPKPMNSSKPIPPKDPPEAPEQPADVASDRSAPGSAPMGPGKKPPLPINEIVDQESDVEGG
jgi:hypothetical protein